MFKQKNNVKSSFVTGFLYRFSQLIAFLLSIHIFTTTILIIALYVSTLFLFSNLDSLKEFIFDYKVHGIIFSALFSILAGRIINQFYDREKDALAKPFNSKLQQFLQLKYYLYSYIGFNIISLVIALIVSYRVFLFYLFYQFLMWFYSHKLSKVLVINNLTLVALTLYPFFGVLVYYKAFSQKISLLAIFLFLVLLIIDIVKDMHTKNVDKIFGYHTLPNTFGTQIAKRILLLLFAFLIVISLLIINTMNGGLIFWYFVLSIAIALFSVFLTFKKSKYSWLIILTTMRFWIFVGILLMLIDGILNHLR